MAVGTVARSSIQPPTINTFPLGRRVAVWLNLGTFMGPVRVNVSASAGTELRENVRSTERNSQTFR